MVTTSATNSQNAILVVAAILYRSPGEVAIFRRGQGMSGAGCWEFPGGKVEPGESPEQALRREIEEELGISIRVESFVFENIHQYPAKKIRLRFYWVPWAGQKFVMNEHDAFQWVPVQELSVDILSEADRPVVEIIKQDPRLKIQP